MPPAVAALPDEVYEAYAHAFQKLQAAVRDPNVSILSIAQELQKLPGSLTEPAARAVALALADALGCLPPRSREHLARILDNRGDGPTDPPLDE